MSRSRTRTAAFILTCLVVSGCQGVAPSPTPTPSTMQQPTAAPAPTLPPTPASTATPRPTAVPTTAPTFSLPSFAISDTGPWVTFTSTELAYSMMVPKSWRYEPGAGYDDFEIVYESDDTLVMVGSRFGVLRREINTPEQAQVFLDTAVQQRTDALGCEPTFEDLRVDGQPAVLVQCTAGNGATGSYDILIGTGTHIYMLFMTFDRIIGAVIGLPDDLEVLRAIADSFRIG